MIGDGFNKSATIAILLADDPASKRTKVGIAVAKPVASKRAKSPVGPAMLENGCTLCSQHFGTGLALANGRAMDHLLMPANWTGMSSGWNVEGFGVKDEVILCDSLFDALLLWSHSYRNVTSLFGEAHLFADLCQAFREFNIRRVMTTCEALAPTILEAGMDCFLVQLPSGLGVSDYARQFEDPAAALGALIRKAEWLGKGKRQAPASAPVLSKPRADDNDAESPAVPGNADAASVPSQPVDSTPSVMPVLPQDVEAEQSDDQRDEVVLNIGHRRYRVRGTAKNLSYDMLRVNLLASTDRGLFVDTFDLYSARHRKTFITQAATELVVEEKVIKKDLGRVLLKLEELQDQQIKSALEPKEILPTMTPQEKEEALRLLRDPKLLDRIVTDIPLVGEATNKLVAYLAAVSRKLDQPLAVIIQSSSAAGKTTLMEAVLSLMPGEDQVKFSAMTGQRTPMATTAISSQSKNRPATSRRIRGTGKTG